ncbi:MAG TPA: sigma-54 dependent transcriptional regulator [Blastocatellia bacterium]|nr:sigma-54 dependent transcriptional regulator [Blastocatellia bacterium]
MAKRGNILVIDDEEIMRDVLESLLSADGYRVELAKTGEEGIDKFQQRPQDVVLLDVSMPGIGGLRTLQEILKIDPEVVVLMITAYATFETAVSAWELGAYSCIRKPFENEHILKVVAAALKRRRKDEERQVLKRALKKSSQTNQIIARSPKMQAVLDLIEQVAPARSTVLVQGESGTGKELVARAIHFSSPRADTGQFVTVNSGNIPTELLESELFGHNRGAFTGAVAAKKGLFEVADNGTIFLDEIGNIGLETQSKLLRVIQEREFLPLGDTVPKKVDVRIIAATNVDLREAVAEGRFREDLFYRLNVISIDIPPLRERREDILPITQHFIGKYSEESGKMISRDVNSDVLALLEAYHWPGNVRELENAIERAVIISKSGTIEREYLREEILNPGMYSTVRGGTPKFATQFDFSHGGIQFYEEVQRFEIELIKQALEQTGGHQSRAAKLLGLNTTTLNSKIKSYNIRI